MNLYMIFDIVQIISSSSFVYWTQEELIFTDRVAPKYFFDSLKCIIALAFTCLWILSNEERVD